jgi:lysyl endopeptidase
VDAASALKEVASNAVTAARLILLSAMARPGTLSSLLAFTLLLPAGPVVAADVVPEMHTGPAVFRAAAPKATPAVPRLDFAATQARLPESARHALPRLSAEERRQLEAPDSRPGDGARMKKPAVRVGIVRALPAEAGFHGLTAGAAPRPLGGGWLERGSAGWIWTASFSSEGAQALRIQIKDAWLPPGSRVFVYGPGGEVFGPYGFDGGTRPEGFWTNTVFASQAIVRVEVADADPARLALARLTIGSLVHIEHPWAASVHPAATGAARDAAGAPQVRLKSDACFVDVSCVDAAEFPNLDSASHAVAQLNFVEPDGNFICSGGLLNTTTSSFVPYLLTANHCFSTQAAATSLEAFFDYKTPSCGAAAPPEVTFPSTLGSTLLATSTTSDFTFVQLSEAPPDGSVFLGWTTGDYAHVDGATLYRISHPNGDPQFYSKHQVEASPSVTCTGYNQGPFLYEQDIKGGTGGGSSGSPVYLADLSVVGQELGGCGINVDDDCDRSNLTIDGAFRVTFPSISAWLAPASPSTCVPNGTTLCLHGGRFQVTAAWTKTTGEHGSGNGVVLTDDSAYFWFFDPTNVEMVMKVLDACAISQKFWVFAGGLTNVFVRITVTDTHTGTVEIYDNPIGVAFAPLQDTKAFACP